MTFKVNFAHENAYIDMKMLRQNHEFQLIIIKQKYYKLRE